VEVLNTNDAPFFDLLTIEGKEIEPYNGTIELTGTLGAFEGEWYNFTMSALDEDGEEDLKFSTNTTLQNLHIDPSTGEVSFMPGQDLVGILEFYIITNDVDGASDSVKIILEVSNVNDAPEVLSIIREGGFLVYQKGHYVNLTCDFYDKDHDRNPPQTIEFLWESDKDGPIGTNQGLTTNGLSMGNHTITITITDSGGLSSSLSILISIIDPPSMPEPNDPDPNATGGEVKTEKEGAPVGLIIFIIIVGIIVLAGIAVLVLTTMKKKDIPEQKEEVPEETPESTPPQEI